MGVILAGNGAAQPPPLRPDAAFSQHPDYAAAVRIARAGDYPGAAAAMGALADREPRSEVGAWARYQQAISYRAAGQPGRARAAFLRVRQDYPDFHLAARAAAETGFTTETRRARSGETGEDCGPRALLKVCQALKVAATLEDLRRAAGTSASGTTLEGLAKAARGAGLTAVGVQVDRNALLALAKPAVAWVDGDHYLALLSVDSDTARVRDPNADRDERLPVEELLRRSSGVLLVLGHRLD